MEPERPALFDHLTQRIRAIEGQDTRDRPALAIGPIERLLPAGLPAGSLVELLAEEGCGAWTLGLVLANRARAGKALVIVDGRRCFYPPAALRLGVDLARAIIIRPASPREAGVALGEALRCDAVGAVLADRPPLSVHDCRKLQLAAEAGGGLGVIVRPASAAREPSFASARLRVEPVESVGALRRFRVEVLRCRNGRKGPPLTLEVDDATGDVRLFTGMAAAKALPARPARTAK